MLDHVLDSHQHFRFTCDSCGPAHVHPNTGAPRKFHSKVTNITQGAFEAREACPQIQVVVAPKICA